MEERRLGRLGTPVGGTPGAAAERERTRRLAQWIGGLGVVWLLWLVFGVKRRPTDPVPSKAVAALTLQVEMPELPDGSPPLLGRLEKINESELVYELSGRPDADEIFVVFHGCHHSATDWWPKSPECEACIGLPHETRVVSWLLHGSDRSSRVAGVVSISSSDRYSKCWQSPSATKSNSSRDSQVPLVLKTWLGEKLPNVTSPKWILFGASSGGSFARSLPRAGTFPVGTVTGIISQVSTPHEAHDVQGLPPLVLNPARRDTVQLELASSVVQSSGDQPISMVILEPLRIDPGFFSRRVGMEPNESSAFYSRLVDEQLITTGDQVLSQDPRANPTAWRTIAEATTPSYLARTGDPLVADRSGLLEELNAAYALHEISSDAFVQALGALDELIQNQKTRTAR